MASDTKYGFLTLSLGHTLLPLTERKLVEHTRYMAVILSVASYLPAFLVLDW